MTQPKVEESTGKVNPHLSPGPQAPFPKCRTSFILLLAASALELPVELDFKVPGCSSSSLRSGPEGWGQGAPLLLPTVKPMPPPPSQPRPLELLLPVIVTSNLEARPWLAELLPRLKLFSGPTGCWENKPPGQAHFPEPGLPSLSPGTLSRNH